MGLQNQLNDMSSGSIPLLLLAQIATYFNYFRSFLLTLFQSLGLSRFRSDQIVHDGFFSAVGSGLAGLIILSDQLSLNNHFFYTFSTTADSHNNNSDCVFCQNTFMDGDQVRMLPCRHVFHRRCFDGWLHHLKFNCPLCRSALISDERMALTEARVGRELVSWFSMR
ncbi:putative transcription factor C2H2 family [Lupinus albus]|uniref:Putative transcription factor C2H2 family n=1 Tax=Lupinus albus TaxID=3870 RepID=A0A6A4QZ24_LUPAL|nr:putative transcription factor C2H2 family [Lupinus albus]